MKEFTLERSLLNANNVTNVLGENTVIKITARATVQYDLGNAWKEAFHSNFS